MQPESRKKLFFAAIAVAAVWLGLRYLLPLVLPFLLGGALALMAEPLVSFGNHRCRLPRWLASGVGVTGTLLGLFALASLLGAAVVRELGNLAGHIPQAAERAKEGLWVVRDWLVGLSDNAPEGLRAGLQRMVLETFDGSSVILQQVTRQLPGVVGTTVGKLGDGALGAGTGILAAYMTSARLPDLKEAVTRRLPEQWRSQWLPTLKRVKSALGGWLKAQLKLWLLVWGIVSVGFLLLRVPYAVAWAALVALVDAVPVLGTGTVLVPWSLVSLLQGKGAQAVGLLGIYGITLGVRTVLEPRLVGKQLGLDPLVTLLALYVGFRLWGIPGLLGAPIFLAAGSSFLRER